MRFKWSSVSRPHCCLNLPRSCFHFPTITSLLNVTFIFTSFLQIFRSGTAPGAQPGTGYNDEGAGPLSPRAPGGKTSEQTRTAGLLNRLRSDGGLFCEFGGARLPDHGHFDLARILHGLFDLLGDDA